MRRSVVLRVTVARRRDRIDDEAMAILNQQTPKVSEPRLGSLDLRYNRAPESVVDTFVSFLPILLSDLPVAVSAPSTERSSEGSGRIRSTT
jgi:hypothetical protein